MNQKNPQTNNFSKEDVQNEVHMPLFDQTKTTDFFDSSVSLASEESKIFSGESVGFLALNQSIFIKQLKAFVYKRIVEKNSFLLINSDNIVGKIFYSCLDENTFEIVVKWKNSFARKFPIFYDSFIVFIDIKN